MSTRYSLIGRDASGRQKADNHCNPLSGCRLVKGWVWVGLAVALAGIGLTHRLEQHGGTMYVKDYHSSVDNRFTLWPSDTTVNEACVVPGWVICGIGWDNRGHMYPLIDDQHVLLSHNQVPPSIFFRDGVNQLHRRRIVDTFTLAEDRNGDAWIRVAKLRSALPATVIPLPISMPKSDTRLPGRHYVVGRGGAIGAVGDCFAGVNATVSKRRETVRFKGVIASSYHPTLPKAAVLGFGDSGSPLISVVNDQWSLVGVAHSVSYKENSNQITNHFFAMAGAHISEMKACGAMPNTIKPWEDAAQPTIVFDVAPESWRLPNKSGSVR